MHPLRLRLTAEQVERLCDKLSENSRTLESTLAAIAAIDVLITQGIHPDEVGGESYQAVKGLLAARADGLRDRLMEESGKRIAVALTEREVLPIADLHDALSREGFHRAARLAAASLGPRELERAAEWVERWCARSRREAAEASPFPDAYNFRQAGIDPRHYGAMEELTHGLRAPSRPSRTGP